MKKSSLLSIVVLSIMILVSCGSSIESDAKKAAELMCEAYQNPDRSIALTVQMEEISEKYTGTDKDKFEEIAEREYEECLKSVIKSSTNSEIMNIGNDKSEEGEEDDYESDYEEDTSYLNDGSSDINVMLESYENYVDEYISLMEKSKSGNIVDSKDYERMMKKAEEFGEKMDNSTDDMTVNQITRFSEIQAKLTTAIAMQ